MILWGGEKTHLVHYPMRRRRSVQPRRRVPLQPLRGGLDISGDPTELHERFKEKCEPVRTLLRKVEAWRMWVLCDRPPIKEWSKGRITLLGDAAHPMLQYLAQGANMALEDAVCLAEQVVAHGVDYAAAFQEVPGAALSAHRARAAHGAAVRRDLSRFRRGARTAQPGAWANGPRKAASTCRGSTAIRRICHGSRTSRLRSRN